MAENHHYSCYQKEKLAKRIEKLKSEDDFINILNIIKKHNSDINITTNEKYHMMYFHKLKNQTYCELDEYINEVQTSNIIKYLKRNKYDQKIP
jgi:hypothetical protein